MSTQYSCDTCSNFRYDDDYEEYVCMAGGMDEDDYSRLMSGTARECPYYHFDNEYDIVKKQKKQTVSCLSVEKRRGMKDGK